MCAAEMCFVLLYHLRTPQTYLAIPWQGLHPQVGNHFRIKYNSLAVYTVYC